METMHEILGRIKMQKNREEIDEQPKKRRKKKSRFGYYLYAIVMLLLTIANVLVALFLFTYVQRTEIKGTKYTEETEIKEWFEADPYTKNSLYAVAKHKFAQPEIPVYLESVNVGWQAPWALRITVQEKPIAGCVLLEQNYVYFAEDGTVMMMGAEVLEGIPIVEGMQVSNASLYEKLEFDAEKVFTYVVNISKQLRENEELKPDRLVWEEDSMNLYFGDICVCLGKINFEEKLVELPPALEALEGKKGKLHLEHFGEMSKNFSFVEEKDGSTENAEEPKDESSGEE